MLLSKTTEYALNILTFMATRDRDLFPAEFLFRELKIPRQYLKRLLTQLSKHGFIAGTRGRNGGFVFARDLATISIMEVIVAMEGKEAMNTCLLGFTACIAGQPCVMHKPWTEARSKMTETLTKTSLADLKVNYHLFTH